MKRLPKAEILAVIIGVAALAVFGAILLRNFSTPGEQETWEETAWEEPDEPQSPPLPEPLKPEEEWLRPYLGRWDAEGYHIDTDYGAATGMSMEIAVSPAGEKIINMWHVSSPPSSRIADFDVPLTLEADTSGSFIIEDDGWGAKGRGRIYFEGNRITTDITWESWDENANWGMPGGKIVFFKEPEMVPLSQADLQLGKLKPGMVFDELLKAISMQPETVKEGVLKELSFPDGTKVTFVKDLAHQVAVSTSAYSTPRGLVVGDSKDKVLSLYGRPLGSDLESWDYRDQTEKLILTIFFTEDRVSSIRIEAAMSELLK